MARVSMGRLGNVPSLQWAEFAMGRDVQLSREVYLSLARSFGHHT